MSHIYVQSIRRLIDTYMARLLCPPTMLYNSSIFHRQRETHKPVSSSANKKKLSRSFFDSSRHEQALEGLKHKPRIESHYDEHWTIIIRDGGRNAIGIAYAWMIDKSLWVLAALGMRRHRPDEMSNWISDFDHVSMRGVVRASFGLWKILVECSDRG